MAAFADAWSSGPATAWSRRPCSRTPRSSAGASARAATWSARRCTSSPTATGSCWPCGPRARRRWCGPSSSTTRCLPWKAWYVTPAFRHERPQAGRYRQHHQVGDRGARPGDPDLDVEVVCAGRPLLPGASGWPTSRLKLNSMGDGRCRPAYVELLRAATSAERRDQLCDEHRARLDANPLRVLDCKRPGLPGGHRRRAPPGRPPVRGLRRPLRPGASRASSALGVGLRARPPAGAGLRLLHPDHLRVRLGGHRGRPERHRRRRPLRRAGRDAGRARRPRASASGSGSSGCCWPATPKACSPSTRRPSTPSWSTWPAGRRPGT